MQAGPQTVGCLTRGRDDECAVAAAAAKRNVEVTPLSRYYCTPGSRNGLYMGFAAVDPVEIRRGVRELEVALRGLARRR